MMTWTPSCRQIEGEGAKRRGQEEGDCVATAARGMVGQGIVPCRPAQLA